MKFPYNVYQEREAADNEGNLYTQRIFVQKTWAVSEAQAINNVWYNTKIDRTQLKAEMI